MSFSFKRNLALLCYGGFYQGCGQELIYNNLFSALFGAGTQLRTVMMKVCFDMLMVQPLVSLPIAYLIKAPIFGYSLADSMRRYASDVKHQNLLKTCWKVWTPTQIVSFTFVPTQFRISFMACVSFFWIIMFSSISSSTTTTRSSGSSSKAESDGISSSARIKQ
jgi:protein Mpv17